MAVLHLKFHVNNLPVTDFPCQLHKLQFTRTEASFKSASLFLWKVWGCKITTTPSKQHHNKAE